MNTLVTGGAGYIGSHTTVELLNSGHTVVIVDNLSNSSIKAIDRIEKITGKKPVFYKIDIRDTKELKTVFISHKFDAVIHFAGLKAVGESVQKPLLYYHNNIVSTLALLGLMDEFNVKQLVFSSSATVYGAPDKVPIKETAALRGTNPYGQTKIMIEQILKDLVATNAGWQITSLRYFNPIGAHKSGLIGEDPDGIPNNLLPSISQFAVGKLKQLRVNGNDYDTPDGTCIRDYIHVVDLVKAHLAALKNPAEANDYTYYNIGTGHGTSVLEMIAAFEKASGKKINYQIVGRRAGDIATCYADPSLAKDKLSWQAEKTILDCCKDSWNWQVKNPSGYN